MTSVEARNSVLAHIRSNWVIYAAVLNIIIYFVTFTKDIEALQEKEIQQDALISQNADNLSDQTKQMNLAVSGIDAKVAEINANVASINTSLKYLDRAKGY